MWVNLKQDLRALWFSVNFGIFLKVVVISVGFSPFNWIYLDNSNLNCMSFAMENGWKNDIHVSELMRSSYAVKDRNYFCIGNCPWHSFNLFTSMDHETLISGVFWSEADVNKFEQCAIDYICYQYMIKDFVVVERRRHFRRQGGAIFTMEMIKRHLLLVYGDAIWEKKKERS